MCCSLWKIRHQIWKNTKFKLLAEFLCTFQFFLILVGFIIVAVVVPIVGSIGTINHDLELSRLAVKPDVPHNISLYSSILENLAALPPNAPERPTPDAKDSRGDVNLTEARNFIKLHASKYKRSVSEVHFQETQDFAGFHNNNLELAAKAPQTHIRQKRTVILADPTVDLSRSRRKIAGVENDGTFVINDVYRTTPQYFDGVTAVDINIQRIQNQTLVFSIQEAEGGRELKLSKLHENGLTQTLMFKTKAPNAVTVDVLNIKDKLFAFTTVNHDPQSGGSPDTINIGSILYKINFGNQSFGKEQRIHLPYASSSAFWVGMGEEANDNFLAIAPSKVIDGDRISYDVVVPVYRWQGGYYDYVFEVPAKNPQSIQHFGMLSHDYLAVANFQDNTGSTSIQSEIFKYLHKESRFVSFQKIQTYGAKDIRHFTFENADGRREEHFLAIANNCKRDENGESRFLVQSSIMKFSGLRFLPFKSIYTFGALQFLPVKHAGKFFLVLADMNGIRILQFNGWTFVETFSAPYLSQQTSPFSIKLRELSRNNISYFTIASTAKGVQNGIFAVNFETRNDRRKLITSVGVWCDAAAQQVQGKDLYEIESKIDAAPKRTDEQVHLNGTLTFSTGVKVKTLKSQALHMGRDKTLGEEEFKRLASSLRDFRFLMQKMAGVNATLKNCARKSRDEIIEGPVLFMSIFYHNPELKITNLQVENLGSVVVSSHLDHLVFLHKPQILKFLIANNVFAADIFASKLNGGMVDDYARRSPTAKQIFSGRNEFQSIVEIAKGIEVEGTFAGLSFKHPTFLLANGNQTFPIGVTMKLDRALVKNLYTRYLNGHNVFRYLNDAVKLTGGTIQAEKTFKQVYIKSGTIIALNNVNIDSLYERAIYTDLMTPQAFIGNTTYIETVAVNEINPENPMINSLLNPELDFINIESGSYIIQELRIHRDTQIDHLLVKRQLNNIKVKNDTKLDIFLKNSAEPQIVRSKTLKAIQFFENVAANELVDGVPLSTWSPTQEIYLENTNIQGVLNVAGNIQTTQGVSVSESFTQGSSDVLNVLKNSAMLDTEILPGHCTLKFDALDVLGNSDILAMVNNVQPSQWVINSATQEVTITAEKTFASTVHLEKDAGATALFGSKGKSAENVLSVLPNLLLDGADQTITSKMIFTALVNFDVASCPDTILNDTPFEHLLRNTGNQDVQVDTIFRHNVMINGGMHVMGDVSVAIVNGIDINAAVKDTLRTGNETQTILESATFTSLNVQTAQVEGSFASTDVNSLYGNVILKNSKDPSVLNGGHLSFASNVELDRLDFVGTLNRIHATEWGVAWLLTRTNQIVNSKVIFANQLTAVSFQAPSVNNVNINQLASGIVRTDKNEILSGTLTFMNPVEALAGIEMPNEVKVNGIDLRRDVLLKSSPEVQTISGDISFKSSATIDGSLVINDLNNFDLANFINLHHPSEPPIKQDSPLPSLVINGNVRMENEPWFERQINEHLWNEIMSSIWFRNQDVVLRTYVHFSSLQLTDGGDMSTSAKLNDINLKELQENYASKTRQQVWTGHVKFMNIDRINQIVTESLLLNDNGRFNGVNIQEFFQSVLRYTSDQVLHGNMNVDMIGTIRLDTTDGATINSLTINDFVTYSGPNIIQNTKHFDEIIAKSIWISPATVIDGVNMGYWNDNAVRRTGSFKIKGPIQFESLATPESVNVIVNGNVDGVKFNLDNLFTTDQNQKIYGPVTIKKSENLPSGESLITPAGLTIEGKMNDINIQDSISKLVFKDEKTPIKIQRQTVFDAPLRLNQMRAEALVQGHDVSAAIERFKKTSDEISSDRFVAQERYMELLTVTNKLLVASEKHAMFLKYYVLTQTIQVPSLYVIVLQNVGHPTIAIGYQKYKTYTTENWLSYNSGFDYYQTQIGSRVQMEGAVVGSVELQLDNGSIFAFAVNSVDGRPAQSSLEVLNSMPYFEINKSPDKLDKIFILKSVDVGTARVRPVISQIIYSNEINSLQSFSLMSHQGLTSCLAATTRVVDEAENSTQIFCLDKLNGQLSTVQEINFDSPSLMTSTIVATKTLLIVLTRSDESQPEGLLEVWKNVNVAPVQFAKVHCLPVFNGISLDSLTTGDGRTFLAVASGPLKDTNSGYQGSVFIYRYTSATQQFNKMQTIEISHPLDVKLQWIKKSNEVVIYVLSDSVTNNVQVYIYKGLAGWNLRHQFTLKNGKSIAVSDFTLDGKYRAQLLVRSPTQTNVYAAELMGFNSGVEEMKAEVELESHSSNIYEFIDVGNL